MPLTILTDSDVKDLLHSLTREDILDLQHSLRDALHSYSTGTNENGCCSMYQPQRVSISVNGNTTLFMPASSSSNTGMKIVTLAETDSSCPKDERFRSDSNSIGKKDSNSTTSSSSPRTSISTSTSNLSISPTSRSSSTTAISTPAPSIASSQSTTPRGSLTLLDSSGSPLGLVNAEELTAFRTALAATLLFTRRKHVSTLTVFGAGKQAYWHIRLCLLLRGPEIKRVNIINRTFARAQPLLKEFYSEAEHDWRASTKFSVLSTEYGEYARLLKEEVRKADVIFCCTPSLTPLFPAEFLTSSEGRKKGRLVSAIGSYKPHMCELHPDILRQAVAPAHGNHHHKHARQEGVIVVDSLESCMKEAGEVIQAGLGPEQLVEMGELLMLKKQAMQAIENGGGGDKDCAGNSLREWLAKGNVIYKSVGMGLMDLVVGGDLVALASEKGVGTRIDNF
ncbi:MAG: hypothetical protein M1827_003193 [Pycnora praestabilis]|nr:MAG: hypothetical protein M1827_003193 [Pycnora praestabilis]